MTLLEWNMYLGYIAEYSEAIPLLFALYLFIIRYRSVFKVPAIRVILWYSVWSFGIKMSSNIYMLWGDNNLLFYSLLGFVECWLLTTFYFTQLPFKRTTQRVILTLITLTNLIIVVNQDYLRFNSLLWTIDIFWVFCLSLYFLYYRFSNINISISWPDPAFIINAGLILYLCGSFFVYLMGWYLLMQKAEGYFANGWLIVSVAVMIKSIFITWAIHKAARHG